MTSPSLDPFKADIADNAGYRYTTNITLSSRLANRRYTDASLAVTDFRGRRVVDIGCGDGTFTVQLVELGGAGRVTGLDPVATALPMARRKIENRPVDVVGASAYALPFRNNTFDIAYVRSVLHHMSGPLDALREALRVARIVVVVEPNGYSPVLKLLERFSKYHVEHGERSYAPRRLDSWVRELGGRVEKRVFVGLVPMFCPDWMAAALKPLEPAVERIALLRNVACGQYVFSAGHAQTDPLSPCPSPRRQSP